MSLSQSPTNFSKSEEQAAIYAPMARGYSLFLIVFYSLITLAHLAVLKGQIATIMAMIAAASAAIIFYIRHNVLAHVKKLNNLGLSVVLINSIVMANVVSHAFIVQDPSQFVYLLMVAFSSAILGPGLRFVGMTLALVAFNAVIMTVFGPPTNIVTNSFSGATGVLTSFAAAGLLFGSVEKQMNLRWHAIELLGIVEEERLRVQDLATEADFANRAKTDFLANMSHELRTPLNGVLGIAHALAATKLDQNQREMVDLIDASGRTLTTLLSDILDFTKIEAGKVALEKSAFDLRFELDASAMLFKTFATEKQLDFTVTYGEPANGWFYGDATRIKQVLANLISNAVKFTEKGGIEVWIDWLVETEVLEIKVSDSGIGFDEETGQKLFQRFVQADNSITRRFGGTGLGLAICRGLIEAMGGGMDWKSTPGIGSSFTVRIPLPAHEAPVSKVANAFSTGATPHPGSEHEEPDTPLRILVAEDHPTNQKVIQLILEPLGAQVTMCDNGQIALDAFKANSFDIVLMDMQMPVMDGLTATQAIRDHERSLNLARTPVIMVTANAMRQHRDQAIAAGANSHLAKPVTPTSLTMAIANVLEEQDTSSQELEQTTEAL
jgi:signal transduction histidine kinase/FixJ family two-component response regulator